MEDVDTDVPEAAHVPAPYVESGYPTSATFDEAGYRRSLHLMGVGFLILTASATMGAFTIRRLATQLSRMIGAPPDGDTEPRTANLRPDVPDSATSVPSESENG